MQYTNKQRDEVKFAILDCLFPVSDTENEWMTIPQMIQANQIILGKHTTQFISRQLSELWLTSVESKKDKFKGMMYRIRKITDEDIDMARLLSKQIDMILPEEETAEQWLKGQNRLAEEERKQEYMTDDGEYDEEYADIWG